MYAQVYGFVIFLMGAIPGVDLRAVILRLIFGEKTW